VLSCGHSSLTLYIQLYLAGYGLELADLETLRTWGSLTPGHPEHGHTAGVETTTARSDKVSATRWAWRWRPAASAGCSTPTPPPVPAPSTRHLRHRQRRRPRGGHQRRSLVDRWTPAARQLVLLYDDNRISIEDDTAIAFSEDVALRYEAYGWHVQDVDWTNDGTGYAENVQALFEAYRAAKAETRRPSFIKLRTIIAYPAPNARTPARRTGPLSVPTRSRPPSGFSASTPTSPSTSPTR